MKRAAESLGFGSLLALGINGIVGVGIFFAPSEVGALVPVRVDSTGKTPEQVVDEIVALVEAARAR